MVCVNHRSLVFDPKLLLEEDIQDCSLEAFDSCYAFGKPPWDMDRYLVVPFKVYEFGCLLEIVDRRVGVKWVSKNPIP